MSRKEMLEFARQMEGIDVPGLDDLSDEELKSYCKVLKELNED